jgi:hypothetical protein
MPFEHSQHVPRLESLVQEHLLHILQILPICHLALCSARCRLVRVASYSVCTRCLALGDSRFFSSSVHLLYAAFTLLRKIRHVEFILAAWIERVAQ